MFSVSKSLLHHLNTKVDAPVTRKSPYLRSIPKLRSSRRHFTTQSNQKQNYDFIPRHQLFVPPTVSNVKISPCGNYISAISVSLETRSSNIWIKEIPRDGIQKSPFMVTNITTSGLEKYVWSEDSTEIYFIADSDGKSSWHLHKVDLKTRAIKNLTNDSELRVLDILSASSCPDDILFSCNKRSGRIFDMYRLDRKTETWKIDSLNTKSDNLIWIMSQGQIIASRAIDSISGRNYIRTKEVIQEENALENSDQNQVTHNNNNGYINIEEQVEKSTKWNQLIETPWNNEIHPLSANPQGSLIAVSRPQNDYSRVLRIDMYSGKVMEIIDKDCDLKCDVEDVLIDPISGEPQIIGYNDHKLRWRSVDPSYQIHVEKLDKLSGEMGQWKIISRDKEMKQFVVQINHCDQPDSYWLYDTSKYEALHLFDVNPYLDRNKLGKTIFVDIPTSDSSKLHGYLTLPSVYQHDQTDIKQNSQKFPLVVNVHAGPWGQRESTEFLPMSHWLSSRGYAVLRTNYRGSSGFGKTFADSADKKWGNGLIQQDLKESVEWAIQSGFADPRKVAIMGSVFGGYAALCGLAFNPETYTCGISVSGPCNLSTWYNSFPSHWQPPILYFKNKVGRVDKDEDLNQQISPLFHASKIKAPLLIIQGAQDRAAAKDETLQLVTTLRQNNVPVELAVYDQQADMFASAANSKDFLIRTEKFLGENLGGIVEDEPLPVPNSTYQPM